MSDDEEIARQITMIEGRLIAAKHLKLTDRVRLLESEKQRLEARLAELRTEPGS